MPKKRRDLSAKVVREQRKMRQRYWRQRQDKKKKLEKILKRLDQIETNDV